MHVAVYTNATGLAEPSAKLHCVAAQVEARVALHCLDVDRCEHRAAVVVREVTVVVLVDDRRVLPLTTTRLSTIATVQLAPPAG